jgi:hypothetical protein
MEKKKKKVEWVMGEDDEGECVGSVVGWSGGLGWWWLAGK